MLSRTDFFPIIFFDRSDRLSKPELKLTYNDKTFPKNGTKLELFHDPHFFSPNTHNEQSPNPSLMELFLMSRLPAWSPLHLLLLRCGKAPERGQTHVP